MHASLGDVTTPSRTLNSITRLGHRAAHTHQAAASEGSGKCVVTLYQRQVDTLRHTGGLGEPAAIAQPLSAQRSSADNTATLAVITPA